MRLHSNHYSPEVSGILELGNVWVFVQLIHRPMMTKNQLLKNPYIAQLETSYQLWLCSIDKIRGLPYTTSAIFLPFSDALDDDYID